MEKVGRRTFLQLGVAGIISLVALAWNKLTINHFELLKQKVHVFPFNKNKSISFIENYIIINKKETTTVLSAHCTHLGCIINQTENDRLVCPCHGSEYDLEGNVVKGPAYQNLEIIPSEIMDDGQHIEMNE
jgi:cytochrome b6-f complex iron-sulfur subunit